MTGLPQIAAVVLAVVIIIVTISIAARRGRGANPAGQKPAAGIAGSLACAVLLAVYVAYWLRTGGPLYAVIVCAIGAVCAVGLAGVLYRTSRSA